MWTRSYLRVAALSTARGRFFVTVPPRGLTLDTRRVGSSFSGNKKTDDRYECDMNTNGKYEYDTKARGGFVNDMLADGKCSGNTKAGGKFISDTKASGDDTNADGGETKADGETKAGGNTKSPYGGYFDTYFGVINNDLKDVRRLSKLYRTTAFETTLKGTPQPVLWTVAVAVIPLVAGTAGVLVTTSCGDYSWFVATNVSMYVCAANALWQYDSPSLSSYWQVLKAVHPTALCIAATCLPPFLTQLVVLYASFRMTARLTSDHYRPVAAMPPWFRPLVLAVFGICVSNLGLAGICSMFSLYWLHTT